MTELVKLEAGKLQLGVGNPRAPYPLYVTLNRCTDVHRVTLTMPGDIGKQGVYLQGILAKQGFFFLFIQCIPFKNIFYQINAKLACKHITRWLGAGNLGKSLPNLHCQQLPTPNS